MSEEWTPRLVRPAEKIGEFVVLTVQATKSGEEPIEREFRTTNPDGELALHREIAQWVKGLNGLPKLLTKFAAAGPLDLAETPIVDEAAVAIVRAVRRMRQFNWIRDNVDPDVVNTKEYRECVASLKREAYDDAFLKLVLV